MGDYELHHCIVQETRQLSTLKEREDNLKVEPKMEKIQIYYYAQKESFVVRSVIYAGTKFCLYSGLFLLIHGVYPHFYPNSNMVVFAGFTVKCPVFG